MKTTMIEILGFIWALPVTLIGFLVVLLCGGWAHRINPQAGLTPTLVFALIPRKMWMFPSRLAGVTLGAFILVREVGSVAVGNPLIRHELEHVRQCFILGPFVLVLYPLASFLAWLLYRKLYRGNYFEMMARIETGQKP